jgi:hypothetical protein
MSYLTGLMSAMGYYPSKKEIENIMNEVKYKNPKNVETVDFDFFVK